MSPWEAEVNLVKDILVYDTISNTAKKKNDRNLLNLYSCFKTHIINLLF